MATFSNTNTPFLQTSAQLFILPVNSAGKTLDNVVERCHILYPDNYKHYRDLCVDGSLKEGTSLLVTRERDRTGLGVPSNNDRPKYIANLVVADHPYHPPREKWITQALQDLHPKVYELVRYEGLRKIALLAHPLIFPKHDGTASKLDTEHGTDEPLPAELRVPVLDWEKHISPLIHEKLATLPKVHIDIHLPRSMVL